MSSTTRKRPDRYARLLKRLRALENENAALRSRIKTLEERPPFVMPRIFLSAPSSSPIPLTVTCGGGQ